MYEAFFQLRSRPFASVPRTKSYFPAAVIEDARRRMERLIERGEGPGLVIGPPGTGKTMLCHLLAERFNGPYAVALLSSGRLKTCRALLQAIHYELGLPYRGLEEGELRLSLIDFLEPKEDGPQALLLLIDEAHTLPWRLLDEVRLITNLVRAGEPRVRVVLAGGPSLEERFASPKLGSFAQRVAGRCYLEPLNRAETAAYTRAQIVAAGGDPDRLMTDATLDSIYRASDGIPRLINQVCDHGLVLASLGGQHQLTSEAIDEAWADLQQLPAPWSPGAPDSEASQIVEFGQLSDDGEAFEAIPFRKSEPALPATPLHLATPDEQLDAISEQLAEIEPREVSSTTEVDLDFPEFGDPFGEQFAEEELVLNDYDFGVEIFAEVPRVSSLEGRQLGAMLPQASLESVPSRASASRVQEAWNEPFEAASDPVLPEEDEMEVCESEPLAAETPQVAASRTLETAAPRTVPQVPAELAREPQPAARQNAFGQRPQIILEDARPAQQVVKPSRPSEFRQLFSKLRRG